MIQENKTYYKVVSQHLTSAVISDNNVRIQYLYGKTVRPIIKGSLIFVFDSLSAAEQFRDDNCNSSHQIWGCRAEAPRKLRIRLNTHIPEKFKEFWRLKSQGRTCHSFSSFETPKGTMGCKGLKLLNKIS